MASLTGQTIQSTYDGLLKTSDSDAITSSLKRITDGLGNFTPLYLSSTAVEVSSALTATSFVRTGGTSSQFLKADGSVDSSTYTPTSRTLTINGETYDLSANRSWTIAAGVTSFNTRTGAITLTSGDVTGALGYTPYNATNPAGYISGITRTQVINALATGGSPFEFLKSDGSVDTNSYVTFGRTLTINGTTQDLSANRTFNVGTVTSVSGTGTVSGLTLTGSVTSSGSLTLGGTLTLTSGQVTSALGYTPVPNTRTLTINGTTFDLTADRSWTIPTGVTGSGTAGRIPVFATSTSIGDSQIFTAFDETAGAMIGIGATPNASPIPSRLYVSGNSYMAGSITATGAISSNQSITAVSFVRTGGTASQLLAANGSVVTAGTNITISGGTISATGGLSGSLTTNFIPKATGATSLANSLIFDNGTNVGIGTTSPSGKLHVNGGDSVFGNSNLTRILGASQVIDFTNAAQNAYVDGRINGLTLKFYTNSGSGIDITSGGNVGIGTSSPNAKFEVAGVSSNTDFRISRTVNPSAYFSINAPGGTPNASTLGINGVDVMTLNASGNVGIGTSSPATLLDLFRASFPVMQISSGTITGNVGLDTANNFMYVGTTTSHPLVLGSAGSERMRITSGGNVGIGTSSPGYRLDVVGTIYASGDVLAFSDISVKENIRPIDNALERVLNSRGVVYDRIDNEEKDNIGFIAQELEVNFPELVSTKPDGTKSVKYQNAVAILFEAIKEQQAQIDELKKLLN